MKPVALAIGLLLLLGCSRGGWDGVLFDFESDAELDKLHWRCGQLFALSDEHAAHGSHSLRLELYPSPYPGLRPGAPRRDWSGFGALCFDVYNPQEEALSLYVRIDDAQDRLDYGDRYNQVFRLSPGANQVWIPLETLATSGSKRKLDVSDIWAVYIFLSHPEAPKVLYFDHIRLEQLAS